MSDSHPPRQKLNSVQPLGCRESIRVQVKGSQSSLRDGSGYSWVSRTCSEPCGRGWEDSSFMSFIENSLFWRMVSESWRCCFNICWQSAYSTIVTISLLLGSMSCLIFCSRKMSSFSSSLFFSTHRRDVCSRLSSSSRSFSMLSLIAALIFSQCFFRDSFLSWQMAFIPSLVRLSLFSWASKPLISSCSLAMFFSSPYSYAYLCPVEGFYENSITLGALPSCRQFSLSALSWKSRQNFCSLSSMRTTSNPLLMIPMAQVEQNKRLSLITRQVACFGHPAHLPQLSPVGAKLYPLAIGLTGKGMTCLAGCVFPPGCLSLSGEGWQLNTTLGLGPGESERMGERVLMLTDNYKLSYNHSVDAYQQYHRQQLQIVRVDGTPQPLHTPPQGYAAQCRLHSHGLRRGDQDRDSEEQRPQQGGAFHHGEHPAAAGEAEKRDRGGQPGEQGQGHREVEDRQDDRRGRVRAGVQGAEHQQRHPVGSQEDPPLRVGRGAVQGGDRHPLQNTPLKHRPLPGALPPRGGDLHLHGVRPGHPQKLLQGLRAAPPGDLPVLRAAADHRPRLPPQAQGGPQGPQVRQRAAHQQGRPQAHRLRLLQGLRPDPLPRQVRERAQQDPKGHLLLDGPRDDHRRHLHPQDRYMESGMHSARAGHWHQPLVGEEAGRQQDNDLHRLHPIDPADPRTPQPHHPVPHPQLPGPRPREPQLHRVPAGPARQVIFIKYSIIEMESILEQKRKGEKNFRNRIDEFLIKSPYTKEEEQLTIPILQELLAGMEGVCINGRVNVEKLCERVGQSEGPTYGKELQRLIGRKEMKLSELHQLLKNFELTQFDLEEEMVRHFFEAGALSLTKMDAVMAGLGMPALNSKDREILVECFDYDRNKQITRSDLSQMMTRCVQGRERDRKSQTPKLSQEYS